jgi:hypothetical protein
MSIYFTTERHGDNVDVHADAPNLNAAPKFIGLSPRRAASEMTKFQIRDCSLSA